MLDNDKYFLGTVGKALAVLELFTKHKKLGITEIARNLSTNKSNVFRLVITLEHWGYLEKTDDAKYILGTKLLYLGNLVFERQEIVRIVRPFLQKLTGIGKETAFMAMLNANLNVIFLTKEVSQYSMQMRSTIGLEMPTHTTADGKVLLAFSTQATIERFLETHVLQPRTPYSFTDKEKFRLSLVEIQRLGYAEDNQETEMGLLSVAAPVFNVSNEVVCSVSLTGPIYRMAENMASLAGAVKQVAMEISQALGALPPA